MILPQHLNCLCRWEIEYLATLGLDRDRILRDPKFRIWAARIIIHGSTFHITDDNRVGRYFLTGSDNTWSDFVAFNATGNQWWTLKDPLWALGAPYWPNSVETKRRNITIFDNIFPWLASGRNGIVVPSWGWSDALRGYLNEVPKIICVNQILAERVRFLLPHRTSDIFVPLKQLTRAEAA
jgi:hypothetical protein